MAAFSVWVWRACLDKARTCGLCPTAPQEARCCADSLPSSPHSQPSVPPAHPLSPSEAVNAYPGLVWNNSSDSMWFRGLLTWQPLQEPGHGTPSPGAAALGQPGTRLHDV